MKLNSASTRRFSYLFGGKWRPEGAEEARQRARADKKKASLLEENQKFGSMPTHPLGTATVFHAGVIGDGKRGDEGDWPGAKPLSKDTIEFNQVFFKKKKKKSGNLKAFSLLYSKW